MPKSELRSELRVTMPRDLYIGIKRLAEADDRLPADWARMQFRAILKAVKGRKGTPGAMLVEYHCALPEEENS